MNLIEKIVSKHLVRGVSRQGSEVSIRIEQTLTQDATGTLCYLQFEALNIPRVKTDLSVSYIDHNTVQMGFENSDDHLFLKTTASRFGAFFSMPGNGICHQVHLERFAKPGATLLGSDSHTPTAGGIGSLAIGAGGLDVALAMAGIPFVMAMPKVINIRLTGKLSNYASAKDVILHVLSILTTKGNVGYAIEYTGEGLKTLSVPDRATITNMGAELGVTASVFPSDNVTLDFLQKQSREKDFIELSADEDATYDKTIEIDLGKIKPMVALPHSPDNVAEVSSIKGKKVDQVCIGSCTNSSYNDLMTVAKILEGKKVSDSTSVIISPGSKQVFSMIAKNGALKTFIESNCRIAELTCGFCIGQGYSPKSKGISLRTNNRNFKGRSGTSDAEIYLISPKTAALCALHGTVQSPEDFEIPLISTPDKFIIDDSMMIKPDFAAKIIRGPNILPLPKIKPLNDTLEAVATLKVGDKITTDHIMPAGQRLKFRSNVEKYSTFVFEPVDPDFPKRSLQNKEKGISNIVIAGQSYGQGSSREHAALCPAFLGVKAVIAKSIERIHMQNLINFGIIPLIFENLEDYDLIDMGDNMQISNLLSSLKNHSSFKLLNKTKNKEIILLNSISSLDSEILIAGGKLNYYSK